MWTCAGVLALAACACAITRDQLYPHGPGLDLKLPRGSEIVSPEVPLKVRVIFYGETYESIYVNNFGVLSFRTDISTFLNAEFPLPYPSIAAFYSNVDTTETGAVYYRETSESHVLLKAEESVQNNFHDYYDFHPSSVFLATWVDVQYSGSRDGRKNTYQVAVISNGTESFVEFLYPDKEIQWIQKEMPPDSLPDAKAQAGFVAEDGRMLLLRGSGSHQIRNIVARSNTREPGKYVFRVGQIPQDGNIAVPDLYNQNEVEDEEESKTCAQSGPSVCHMQARCVDYLEGICCKCNEGFYGNGKSCVKDDAPLRVHGKLNGLINDVSLNDVDIQAYVVVADGRSYTALSQAPSALGSSLQLVNVLGGVIGWLFAKPSGAAVNGYQLTGAVFNHTADIFFPKTNNRVTLTQEFLGHDVFDQVTLDADVRGSLPPVDYGVKLQISEYEEQYTIIEPGLIRSESTRTLIDPASGTNYEQKVSQTFTYYPCHNAPASVDETVSSTLRVNKNYLGFEPNNGIVRYGMSNKIMPLGQEDPCIVGRSTCGAHSTCVVQGSSFTCVCDTGFTNIYQDDAVICIDIDECSAGNHNCDTNADCYNHDGGFQCRCRNGFEGNGITCNRVSQCRTQTCNQYAQCIEGYNGEPTCVCNPGYAGDGQRCWVINNYTCDVLKNCSPFATCNFSPVSNSHICQCNYGYVGDGYSCSLQANTYTSTLPPYTTTPTPTTDEPENNQTFVLPNCNTDGCQCPAGYSSFTDARGNDLCRLDGYEVSYHIGVSSQIPDNDTSVACVADADCGPIAVCSYSLDPLYGQYVSRCVCPRGYEGNGYDCIEVTSSIPPSQEKPDSLIVCVNDTECPPNAVCTRLEPDYETSHCVCLEGYVGDAYECIEPTSDTCYCGANAHCYRTVSGEKCVCDASYYGDGYNCKPKITCTNSSDCDSHSECRLDSSNQFMCQCVEGYTKDENEACILDRQLCNGGMCAEHASCLLDEEINVYYCHCDPGYTGEGTIQCTPQEATVTCEVANDCHEYAVCTRTENSYQCVCREDFIGDGYDCRPEPNCRNDPSMCDAHASCIKRSEGYVCECNSGFSGNGAQCVQDARQSGNFLVASDGVFVYRVPFQASARDYARPINSGIDQIAVGIDTDCQTGKIYWGDINSFTIKRANYDGSSFELFINTDIKAPEGVAIDWAARNIFWTDSKKLTIEVANLDTKSRKVLFSSDIRNPRGIAVHPRRGKIFWTDWNRLSPKIEWANMDGSERGVFVDSSEVKLPNSLAIDWGRDRLCYTDAGLSKIKCVNLDTLEIETVVPDCLYPFGLAINGDTFYWTDWKILKLQSLDTRTQRKSEVPIGTAPRRLYGVALAPDQCPASDNVCRYRYGNCRSDQLCLPDGHGGRSCVDTTGYLRL